MAHVVVGMATVYLALACIPTTLGWTQVGGKVNPMGEREKVRYVRLGRMIDGPGSGYGVAVFVIDCTTGRARIQLERSQRGYPSPAGSVRVDEHPPIQISWQRVGNIPYVKLWEEPPMVRQLRAGNTLTISAEMRGSTAYFRFGLDGFADSERRCMTAPGVPESRRAFDSLRVAIDSLLLLARPTSRWIKMGGEVNPLGAVEPVRFHRIGWATDSIPEPYSEPTSALTIDCNQTPPLLVVSVLNSPRLDGSLEPIGQARIDDGPLHPVKWQDADGLTITVLAGGERIIDPRFADLRDPMQAGDTLTVSAPTNAGTLFFRFVLDGLEAQTAQCSAEAPEVVESDTLTVTKSLR